MPQSLQAAATQHAPRCLGSDAWQALQNRGRDVTYLCTVLVATCLLAARIIPSYCDSYPSCVGRTWSRRAVCGCLLPSGTGSTGQERSAVSQAVLVINLLVQVGSEQAHASTSTTGSTRHDMAGFLYPSALCCVRQAPGAQPMHLLQLLPAACNSNSSMPSSGPLLPLTPSLCAAVLLPCATACDRAVVDWVAGAVLCTASRSPVGSQPSAHHPRTATTA